MLTLPVQVDKAIETPDLALDRAGRWLLQSGIREASGGVARYYLVNERRNLPVSTEITGYAASAFAYLAQITGDRAYRDAAVQTCRFLIDRAWNPNLATFPFECHAGAPSYFFDCGIIIRGLLATYRLTGVEQFAAIATRAGRSMARDFLTPTAIHPIIDLPSRKPWPYEKRWSREPGCFQLKSALAWHDLATLTGDADFLHYWESALTQALATWDNFLPGTPERPRIMDRLHAHSYFLEALLAVTNRDDCAAALSRGIAKTAFYLRNIAPEVARSDVYAQLLRVRLIAHALGAEPLDTQAALEEAAILETFQYSSSDAVLDGAYFFGKRGNQWLPYANPVSTSFCLQALEMWRQHESGQLQPALHTLI